MSKSFRHWRRALLIAGGLLLGAVLMAVFVINRQAPTHGAIEPPVPELRVIQVRPVDFRLEARGHGVSRAANSWQASANVAGRVVQRHARLESGALVPKGTLLLELDPSRYELAIAETEAELASLKVDRDRLDTEEENTRRLLELEKERLALSEQELSRLEQLVKQGSVSRSRRDEQQRATVAQRQAVAALENELALLPVRRESLEAQLSRAATRREQAQQDLKDTRFEAPYDLRISEVEIELHQHAAVGQRLFRADSIEAAEVEVHMPLAMVRRLMGSVLLAAPPADALDVGERLDLSAIGAEVRLAGAPDIRWPARVTGIASGLDPITRTVRVVVTVDDPYREVAPPERLPLQPGMYVEVRLTSSSREPLLVMPAAAVHDNEVYRVAEGDRLERQPVSVAFQQNDLAVIERGLSPGDSVIVDDPVPALDGMAIKPRRDEALERHMQARAQGETL